jgi:hypothetical protein
MATYDSAWLLSEFSTQAGRPANDVFTSAQIYARLAKAQNKIITDLAARVPQSLYPKVGSASYPTLTTSDNQVFVFGTDANGYAITPIGKVGIYPDLTCIPDDPWTEGFDYLNEGNQIRIPNNRTYAGTLYWRGITNPPDIAASVQPVLNPEYTRTLIVSEAVRSFAREGNRNPDLAALMQDEYDRDFRRFCLMWRTQFRSDGALAPLVSSFANNASWVGGYGSIGG